MKYPINLQYFYDYETGEHHLGFIETPPSDVGAPGTRKQEESKLFIPPPKTFEKNTLYVYPLFPGQYGQTSFPEASKGKQAPSKKRWNEFIEKVIASGHKMSPTKSLSDLVGEHSLFVPEELFASVPTEGDLEVHYVVMNNHPYIYSPFTPPRAFAFLFKKVAVYWSSPSQTIEGLQPRLQELSESHVIKNMKELQDITGLNPPEETEDPMEGIDKGKVKEQIRELQHDKIAYTLGPSGQVEVLVDEKDIEKVLSAAQVKSIEWANDLEKEIQADIKETMEKAVKTEDPDFKENYIDIVHDLKDDLKKVQGLKARMLKSSTGTWFPSRNEKYYDALVKEILRVNKKAKWASFKSISEVNLPGVGFKGYAFRFIPWTDEWPKLAEFDVKV